MLHARCVAALDQRADALRQLQEARSLLNAPVADDGSSGEGEEGSSGEESNEEPPQLPLPLRPRSSQVTCAITCDTIDDPVVVSDGHTYERSSIEAYAAHARANDAVVRSPLTRHRLLTYRDGTVVTFSNYALRS